MTRRVGASPLNAGQHRRGGRNEKAQAGLAINESIPDWAVVLPYWSATTPGYRTVGRAFVSAGSEIQLLPGGPFTKISKLSVSFLQTFCQEVAL